MSYEPPGNSKESSTERSTGLEELSILVTKCRGAHQRPYFILTANNHHWRYTVIEKPEPQIVSVVK